MRSEFERLHQRTSEEAPNFSAVATHVDGRTVVELRGELDMATAPALAERLQQLTDGGAGPVTLDVSGLEFCDSSGLAVLVESHRRGRARGVTVALRSPSRALRRLLSVTHLEDLLEPDGTADLDGSSP
jgi:anti-sigma B factor antagonist